MPSTRSTIRRAEPDPIVEPVTNAEPGIVSCTCSTGVHRRYNWTRSPVGAFARIRPQQSSHVDIGRLDEVRVFSAVNPGIAIVTLSSDTDPPWPVYFDFSPAEHSPQGPLNCQ